MQYKCATQGTASDGSVSLAQKNCPTGKRSYTDNQNLSQKIYSIPVISRCFFKLKQSKYEHSKSCY